jgi:hypothetical protein
MTSYELAIWSTWNAIGYDVDGTEQMTIDQMVEVSLDYIYMYGELSKEELAQWRTMPLEEKMRIGRAALR